MIYLFLSNLFAQTHFSQDDFIYKLPLPNVFTLIYFLWHVKSSGVI